MAIEQWEFFFSVSHLLCHGESVYNGHRRGPVTRTPITERLAVELPIIFLRPRSVATDIRTPNLLLPRSTLKPTAPPPRLFELDVAWCSFYVYIQFKLMFCVITYLNPTEWRLYSSIEIRNKGHKTRENNDGQNQHVCIAA